MLDKSLKLKDSDDDAAVTLMTADIGGIFPGVKDVYELVANTVELVLAMYLLQREIGAAFFLVAVSAIGRSSHMLLAMTSSQHLLSLTYLCLNLHSLQLSVHIRQRRHRPSTNGLGGGNAEACIDDFPVPHQIKSLKMMGLTAYVSRKLRGLRIQEASESKKFRTYIVWILGVGTCRIAPSNAYLCGPHDMR